MSAEGVQTDISADQKEAHVCEAALAVQDTCNLSGVVAAWSRHMKTLWEVARERNKGTDWVNQHPAAQLFADKCADLSRGRSTMVIFRAFDACEKIITDVLGEEAATKAIGMLGWTPLTHQEK